MTTAMKPRSGRREFTLPDTPTAVKVGGRVLRVGDIVKIKATDASTAGGIGHYRIKEFTPDLTTVTLYGGAAGRRGFRTVTIGRVGTRIALADSEFARRWK